MLITIEGSRVTPSTFLAAGQRVTVERTALIDKMLRKGYVVEVEPELAPERSALATVWDKIEAEVGDFPHKDHVHWATPDTVPVREIVEPPSKAASTREWAAFLDKIGIKHPDKAKRSELIMLWVASGRG